MSRAEACARIQCWCSFMQTLPCFVEPRTASSTGVVPPTNSNSPHLADSGATWNVRTDKPRFRDPGCAARSASMALNSRSILSSCRRSSDPLATNGYSRPSLPRATNFFGNCFDRKRSTSGSNPTICACDVTSGGPVSASYCPGTSMPIRNVGDRCLRPRDTRAAGDGGLERREPLRKLRHPLPGQLLSLPELLHPVLDDLALSLRDGLREPTRQLTLPEPNRAVRPADRLRQRAPGHLRESGV